jgi:membrane protein
VTSSGERTTSETEEKGVSGSPSTPDTTAKGSTRRHALVEKGSRAAGRVRTGAPGTLWTRLNGVDFMNSSIQFAALAVLTLFPFLIIVVAEAGGDARQTIITRLGLDENAAKDVNALMSSGHHAVTGLSFIGAALILLGAIGIASTLQLWYQKVYGQPPAKKWTRQLINRLIWLGGLLAYLSLQVLIGRELARVGARAPIYVVTFVVAVAFYWWTAHVLLLGRVSWRSLFPAGLATAICVTGLAVFSALLFSDQIVSSERDYGHIGVVMVLLSYLIGLGVCLHLGAVLGCLWNERHISPTVGQSQETSEGSGIPTAP